MKKLFDDLGFKIHFAAYVGVNILLIAINLLLTPKVLWFYWPLLGWGIGILAHGLAVHYVQNRRVTREDIVRAKLEQRG
jgi:cytochrome b subunit of formate dehydrogenase